MKKALYILVFLLSDNLCFAQKDKIAFYGGIEWQPAIRKYQPAVHLNVRGYINDRVSLGAALSYTSEKHAENFGYLADRTRSNHAILNFLVQNDVINNDKVFFSTYLSTGLYFLSLVNPDETSTQTQYNEIDGMWIVNQYEVPRKLNRDLFFNVQGRRRFFPENRKHDEGEYIGVFDHTSRLSVRSRKRRCCQRKSVYKTYGFSWGDF